MAEGTVMESRTLADDVGVSPRAASMPTVSVVIPCYNAEETLGAQLEALAEQRWQGSWEVLVADNGSTDRSVEIAWEFAERLPDLRVIDASQRRGSAYARNVGTRSARGRSVVYCDADDVVATGWLAAIGNALEQHSFVASRHEFELLNEARLLRTRDPIQVSEVQHLWYPPYLDHASGSGLGIRRELFEAYGGFSEDYPGLQDTEFCVSIGISGTPLHFAADAVVHIRYRDGNQSIFRQASRWAHDNVRLCKRYRRPGESVRGSWKAWLRETRRLVGTIWTYLRAPERRAGLAWQYGWHLGLLMGAIRCCIPPVALDNSRWTRRQGSASRSYDG